MVRHGKDGGKVGKGAKKGDRVTIVRVKKERQGGGKMVVQVRILRQDEDKDGGTGLQY